MSIHVSKTLRKLIEDVEGVRRGEESSSRRAQIENAVMF